MRTAPGGAVVLPPLPPWRAWPLGGVCAGLALGLAEVLSCLLLGEAMPPSLAAAMLVADGLAVAAVAVAIGGFLAVFDSRPGHSALAGALVGPLLFVPVAAPHLLALVQGHTDLTASALRLAVAATVAVAAGLLAGMLGELLERSGRPLSGPGLWLGLAALLVLGARTATRAGELSRPWAGLILLAVVAGIAAGLALVGVSRRHPPRYGQWPGRAMGFAAVALVVSWWPAPDTWLLHEPGPPPVATRPDLLLLVFEPELGDADPFDSLASLLGRDSAVYEQVESGPEPPLDALLGRRDRSLWAGFAARGYRTGAVLRDPETRLALEAERRDARGGARHALEAAAGELTGSALLLSLGPRFLDRLGLDARLRSPEQLRRALGTALLREQDRRDRAPFVWLVDTRGGDDDPVTSESFLVDSLELLVQLGIDATTAVAVAVVRAPDSGQPRLSVAVRGSPVLPPGREAGPVPVGVIADGLRAVANAGAANDRRRAP